MNIDYNFEEQIEENELRREDKFYRTVITSLLVVGVVILFVLSVYNLALLWMR